MLPLILCCSVCWILLIESRSYASLDAEAIKELKSVLVLHIILLVLSVLLSGFFLIFMVRSSH